MNKKGYIFILDVTIALVILIIGGALLFYNFATTKKTIYHTEQLSEDLIGVLAHTNIKDLCIDPGEPSCNCPNYPELEDIVCSNLLQDVDANILSMMSEVIETGAFSGVDIKEIIKEIFVTKNVIDEKRFGFAIIYTDMIMPAPLELYNTEVP